MLFTFSLVLQCISEHKYIFIVLNIRLNIHLGIIILRLSLIFHAETLIEITDSIMTLFTVELRWSGSFRVVLNIYIQVQTTQILYKQDIN